MSINIGQNQIGKIYLGSEEIGLGFLGNTQVYGPDTKLYFIKDGQWTDNVVTSSISTSYTPTQVDNTMVIETPIVDLASGTWNSPFNGAPSIQISFTTEKMLADLIWYNKMKLDGTFYFALSNASGQYWNVLNGYLNGVSGDNVSNMSTWSWSGAPSGTATSGSWVAKWTNMWANFSPSTNTLTAQFNAGSRRDYSPRKAGGKLVITNLYIEKEV